MLARPAPAASAAGALAWLDAEEALVDIRNEPETPHFAIGDDIDAGVGLLLDDLGNCGLDAIGIDRGVEGFAPFLRLDNLQQIGRPRQAPDMSGENTLRVLLHDFPPGWREGSAKGRSGQHCAKRGDRRHEEVCRGGQDYELVRHFERRPPTPGGVVRERLVHRAGAAVWRLSDDRVVTRRHRSAATGPPLFGDKGGIVRVPLDVFEPLPDRGLVAHEHQSAAVPGCRFSGRHFGTKRDAGANDAVALRLRLAAGRIITRVHLPNMRRVGTFALQGVVAVVEFDPGGDHAFLLQAVEQSPWRDGTPIAMSPDLICVLDTVSGNAFGTETIRYGMRVTVIALPAPAVFLSPKGLQHVGPLQLRADG
jgi:hypothetical protein